MKLIFIFLFLSQNLQAYPRLIEWRKNPLIIFENKKNAELEKNELLKSPFFILSKDDDRLQLEVNKNSFLHIFEKSKVQFLEVFEDPLKSHDIFIIDGQFRFKNDQQKSEQLLQQIKTAFFDLKQPPDSDLIVEVDLKKPSVEIRMIKGQWNLEFFSYEKKLTLHAGEKVRFEGVLTDDKTELKYDFLLDGKKVPKGRLLEVEKFNIDSFMAEEKAIERKNLEIKNKAEKKIKDALRKKKEYEDSFLCKGPFGQLNQCAWKIEAQKCFRQRCNVSGQWGDKTERPLNRLCTQDFLIDRCDY